MWDFERPEILFFFFKITCSKKVTLRKRGSLWTLGGMLHAVQALILPGQAFGPRLVVMSWQLERKLLTASGVLQAFQLQQLSRISRFQGMFLDEHLYLLLCFIVFYCVLCVFPGRFSNRITLTSVSNEAIDTYRLGFCGLKTQSCASKVGKFLPRCDACPAGQKQSTGGSTFCEDCGAPQWWWNMIKRAWSVRCPCCVLLLNWMMLLIVYHVLRQKYRTGVKIPFFFFFFVFCCVPPTLLRTEDVAELYLLFHCFVTVDWREVCRPIVFNSFHIWEVHERGFLCVSLWVCN